MTRLNFRVGRTHATGRHLENPNVDTFMAVRSDWTDCHAFVSLSLPFRRFTGSNLHTTLTTHAHDPLTTVLVTKPEIFKLDLVLFLMDLVNTAYFLVWISFALDLLATVFCLLCLILKKLVHIFFNFTAIWSALFLLYKCQVRDQSFKYN